MNFTKTSSLCLILTTASFSAHATVYNVLGGTYSQPSVGLPFVLTSTNGKLFINEGATAYQPLGSIVDSFHFLGISYSVGTAASFPGVLGGGDAPSGNVVDGGIVDMSSFYGDWNGNPPFYQGGTADVTAITGGFRLSWESDFLDGPFITGGPTFWTLDIAEVPVPASVWLFGSGLIGLISLARRSRYQ